MADSKNKCVANSSPVTHQTLQQHEGTGEDSHFNLADRTQRSSDRQEEEENQCVKTKVWPENYDTEEVCCLDIFVSRILFCKTVLQRLPPLQPSIGEWYYDGAIQWLLICVVTGHWLLCTFDTPSMLSVTSFSFAVNACSCKTSCHWH